MQRRHFVLAAALAATLGASAWVGTLPDEGLPTAEGAVVPARPPASAPAVAAVASTGGRAREAWSAPPRAALAAWAATAPAAAPPPAASAPARAAPPRFPYAWIGRLEDGGDVQALLSSGERSFGARAGDVLDGRWRVERVAGARLQLSWLPTGDTVNVELR